MLFRNPSRKLPPAADRECCASDLLLLRYCSQREARHGTCIGFPGCRSRDRKSTRLNSSHLVISYAVFCLKKKKKRQRTLQEGNHSPHGKNKSTRPANPRGAKRRTATSEMRTRTARRNDTGSSAA